MLARAFSAVDLGDKHTWIKRGAKFVFRPCERETEEPDLTFSADRTAQTCSYVLYPYIRPSKHSACCRKIFGGFPRDSVL